MGFNKKQFFLGKEILINFLGQIVIKKRFFLKNVYRYYRFLKD
jgi:hypothetical protein